MEPRWDIKLMFSARQGQALVLSGYTLLVKQRERNSKPGKLQLLPSGCLLTMVMCVHTLWRQNECRGVEGKG